MNDNVTSVQNTFGAKSFASLNVAESRESRGFDLKYQAVLAFSLSLAQTPLLSPEGGTLSLTLVS